MIAGGILQFVVLAVVTQPLASESPQLPQVLLGAAVFLGIGGTFLGRAMRTWGRLGEAADFQQFVQRSFTPIILSNAVREAGVMLSALSVRLGGELVPAAAVVAVITLTLLIELRTPGRLRSEYEMARGQKL